MVKFVKKKSSGYGPSSSLGIVSFSDPRKALIKLTPQLVIGIAIVFGLIVLAIQLF